MMEYNLGAVLVTEEGDKLVGLVTDGDLKRILNRERQGFFELEVKDCMTLNPKRTKPSVLAEAALRTMENPQGNPISVLPVVDDNDKVIGLLRIHDIIRAKIT
jgi:arabinose-5-phosphate isomerase